ncbi:MULTISPECIES: ABC transporter ATP-binding protein [unclassified Granulicatella]|uniref:ABC transporter ATP-binding protein n=1 Tax=unclassified Granulicatella TaxID=2630493 RepID=UPI00142F68DB|nr:MULTISPECIES: ABC transporter ATP-binding protein [unclassified Granulicatella]MBF0780727.1 ABC transporter ATP-binding protein [Granulicatella sp. 19428wC4_WM01]
MIKLKDISVKFVQGQKTITVLNDVNFSLNKAKIVTIVGKSGSGKTTLLKVISGLIQPNSGVVYLDNNNISQLSLEKRRLRCSEYIGFIWQDFKLIDELTVENNILLPLQIHKKKKDNDFYSQLLKQLDIEHLVKKYPSQLSGGEKQRCAIARALITKPKIIIADEPTGSLDIYTADNISQLFLKSVKQFTELVIIVTHDQKLAQIGDEKYEMIDGKVVMCE